MAGGVTTFGADAWLQALFAITSRPTTYYVALTTTEPGIDDDGDTIELLEPSGAAGYARVSYGTGGSNWDSDGQYLFTLNDIDFGVPDDDWGQLPYYALCTAATSGEVYAWGVFDNPVFAPAGYGVSITAGGLVLSLASLDAVIAL